MRSGALGLQVDGPQRRFERPVDECAIAIVVGIIFTDGKQGRRGKGAGVVRVDGRDLVEAGTHTLAQGRVVAAPQFDRLDHASMTQIAFAGRDLVELARKDHAIGLRKRRHDLAHHALDGRPVARDTDVLETSGPNDRASGNVMQLEGQAGGAVPLKLQGGADAVFAARRKLRRWWRGSASLRYRFVGENLDSIEVRERIANLAAQFLETGDPLRAGSDGGELLHDDDSPPPAGSRGGDIRLIGPRPDVRRRCGLRVAGHDPCIAHHDRPDGDEHEDGCDHGPGSDPSGQVPAQLRRQFGPAMDALATKHRHIAAARQVDQHRAVGADAGVIAGERLAQPARFHADDRIDVRIEAFAAAERLHADGVALDVIGLARKPRFDDEPKKGGEPRRMGEGGTGKDPPERGANFLGAQEIVAADV